MLLPPRPEPDPAIGSNIAGISWSAALLSALPALAIVLLWAPSLPFSFQFDDWNVIVDEPRVQSWQAWWQSMPGIRPLLKLSYAVNLTFGADPYAFRAANVMIHAINAMLAFRLLRHRGTRIGIAEPAATQAALLAALLFAVHPVQTEAVTYISGRSVSLAACFCLLSLYCWTRSEQCEGADGGLGWLIACCLTYVAAAATKETALVLPLALALFSTDRPWPATLRRVTPLMVLAASLVVLALSLPTYRRLLGVSIETRSVGDNLITQAHALLYLAGQLVRIGNGNADPQLSAMTRADLPTILLCIGWLAMLVSALLRVRRAPLGSFAVLWFLLWLAPTNSLIARLDVANDRQLYLAILGPAWWLAVRAMQIRRVRPVVGGPLIALLLVLLVSATARRNQVYETEVTFWQDTVSRNPNNARAANNLGMAYALDCRFDHASEQFQRAIELNPDDFRARINLRLLQGRQLPGLDRSRCTRPASTSG